MALVSFRLFSKNLGNLEEFFGQMDYRPPWQKIARTPMGVDICKNCFKLGVVCTLKRAYCPSSRNISQPCTIQCSTEIILFPMSEKLSLM